MRILHIIDSGGMYGAEVMLLNLVQEQVKQGLQPWIASIGDPGCGEKPLECAARKQRLPMVTFRMRPGPNLPGALEILTWAKSKRCDLLHSHGYKGNILFGFLPKRVRQLPLITTVHGWTSTQSTYTRMRLYEWLDRLVLPIMDGVVLVNRGMLSHPRLAARKNISLHVVNNGISTKKPEPYPCEQLKNQADSTLHLVAVGRLSPEKGFDVLLQAMARVRDRGGNISLVLFGEGNERRNLEELINRLNLQKCVYLAGFMAEVAATFPCFDVLVMPSLTEGLPITLLEAMRARLPVIASAVGGIPHVIENERSGLLVVPGKVDSLVDAVKHILASPDRGRQYASTAERLFQQEYSSSRMAEAYLQIYTEILAGTSRENG